MFSLDSSVLKVFGITAKTANADESTAEVTASMRNPYDHDKDNFDVFQTDSSGLGIWDAATRNSDFPAKQSFVIGVSVDPRTDKRMFLSGFHSVITFSAATAITVPSPEKAAAVIGFFLENIQRQENINLIAKANNL
jgi:hypothetical protein